MDSNGKPSTGQLLLLATSSALTALLYSVYRKKSSNATRLREAKKISLDQDLQSILAEAPGKCIPYAVIEGVVRSVKETLSSQFVDNCRGVISRLTLKEKKMVWNRTTHIWNDYEKVIHQRTNTVPFVLASHDDDITSTVRVIRPLDADLDLEKTFENFHPATSSFTSIVGHFLSGERPQGVTEMEEMLRLGANITGVGELVMDGGMVRLQPPKQGLAYLLSNLDYDTLLENHKRSVRLWRILTALTGLVACATLAYVLWRRYTWHREKKKEREMIEEIEEQRRRRTDGEEEGMQVGACVVCLSHQRSCVFLECGHVCSCWQCYRALPAPKKCPMCRATIDRAVTLYSS
ncbi:mitochondrial ubiquitin ligase activator of NFKB 1 [Clarias gariepinus]|uniref:mitochondrial ubiquitin ligase activator of NFKB 1 n=1 Tax=Clarias gariepinus TaxID=13013 RepID=UPI00234DD0EB|nr:mitochondrial ubiquitin ligase activator of NFKB 1 [Clarias gariepinus]